MRKYPATLLMENNAWHSNTSGSAGIHAGHSLLGKANAGSPPEIFYGNFFCRQVLDRERSYAAIFGLKRSYLHVRSSCSASYS